MAQTAKTVRDFLAEVRDAVKEPARAEFAELMKVHVRSAARRRTGCRRRTATILADRVKAEKFKFDTKELMRLLRGAAR